MSHPDSDSVEKGSGAPRSARPEALEARRPDALRVTRATRVAFTAFLLINLVTAGAAIGLLGRMRPAIERIIERNIYSLEAVENMLLVLGNDGGSEQVRRAEFKEALSRAERNVTGDREGPLVARIQDRSGAALSGEPSARREVLGALRELAQVNREESQEADQSAKRLGAAGAWAVSFLALLALGTGLVGLRRFDRRVLGPVDELTTVISDHAGGKVLRRCAGDAAAAAELHDSMTRLNELLDNHAEMRQRGGARDRPQDAALHAERASLLASLDLIQSPTWLLNHQGEVLMANRAALDRVSEERDLAVQVKGAAVPAQADVELDERLVRTEVAGADRWLVQLKASTG